MVSQQAVIDADGHITESNDQLREFMDAPYRDWGASYYPTDNWDRSLFQTLGSSGKDAQTWLDAMDSGGLETAVLYPTSGLGIGWVREPELATAICKAYNTFLSEKFGKASPRLKGVALVPFQDVGEAVKELRRAMALPGIVGAMPPASPCLYTVP